VQAAAAPVFNFKNQITMTLVIVGVEGMVDMAPGSPVLQALKKAAEALSWRLGATRKPEEAPAAGDGPTISGREDSTD
jgi:hypothetical protein